MYSVSVKNKKKDKKKPLLSKILKDFNYTFFSVAGTDYSYIYFVIILRNAVTCNQFLPAIERINCQTLLQIKQQDERVSVLERKRIITPVTKSHPGV